MRVLLVRSKELGRGIFEAVFEILIAVSGPLEFERASNPTTIFNFVLQATTFFSCEKYRLCGFAIESP